MVQVETNREVYKALRNLDAWIVRANWKAYDPFDGLSSPLAKPLTLNVPLFKQFWMQGVRRFPINLRSVLGIKPATAAKAMGFFAQGYLKLYQSYGQKDDLERMKFCLQWLKDHPSPGFKGYGWGNHFDVQSRGGYQREGTPTVVWTSLIGHAFLDAYDALGDERYLKSCAKRRGDVHSQ